MNLTAQMQTIILGDLQIICHNKEFYNITKLIKSIELERGEKYDAHPSIWLGLESTQILISECSRCQDIPEVYYKLKKNVPVQFTGRYIHKSLLDSFLLWLDPVYSIQVSLLLDEHKNLIIDKQIDALEQDIFKLTEANQRSELRELQLQVTLAEIQDSIQDILAGQRSSMGIVVRIMHLFVVILLSAIGIKILG